jgi:hypothetical protein
MPHLAKMGEEIGKMVLIVGILFGITVYVLDQLGTSLGGNALATITSISAGLQAAVTTLWSPVVLLSFVGLLLVAIFAGLYASGLFKRGKHSE